MSTEERLQVIQELLERPAWAPAWLRPLVRPYRKLASCLLAAVREMHGEIKGLYAEKSLLEQRLSFLEGEFGTERHVIREHLEQFALRHQALHRLVEFEAPGALPVQLPDQFLGQLPDQLPGPAYEDGPDREPPAGGGVNVVGWIDYDFGVAEGARLSLRALEAAGIPAVAVPFPEELPGHSRTGGSLPRPRDQDLHDISIFHLDARYARLIPERLGPDFLPGRYNIFYFNWELPRLPDSWRPFFQWCDEVWVPSRFVADALTGVIPRPVTIVPHPASVESLREVRREEFGLPDQAYIFLCSLDFHSELERKNPMAVIRAFDQAFDRDDRRVALVVKSHNGEKHPSELAQINALMADRPRMFHLWEHLPREQMTRLQAACDAYVSAHRSEGYGLGMVEAMALGKPVLATPWSGSRDFIRENIAFPIPCGRAMLERAYGPYPAGEWWAEPRVDGLAGLMLRLAGSPDLGVAVGQRARTWVDRHLSPKAVGRVYRQRLAEIHAGKNQGRAFMASSTSSRHQADEPEPASPPQGSFASDADQASGPPEHTPGPLLSPPRAPFSRSFEDRFRGPRQVVRDRLARAYLAEVQMLNLEPKAMLLDLGCGRGEWLELMRDQGLHARGLDLDQEHVAACRALGLDAIQADATPYLQALPDHSLSLLTGFHLLEHLPFARVREVLEQALRVLHQGGLAIFETPNVDNLRVGASTFHLDPSHLTPLPGPLLELLGQHVGFAVELRYLHPYREIMPHEPGFDHPGLDRLLSGPLDCAVLLRRP